MTNIKVETITPAIAERYLEGNTANRNIARGRVFQYADDMKSGRWHFSGDPIKFSKHGEMIDGQHRLLAVVHSETKQDFVVIRGLDEQSKYTTDTGLPRSAANLLQFRGEKETNKLSSIIRLCVLHEQGIIGCAKNKRMSPQEIIEFLDKHPEVLAATEFASKTPIDTIFPPSTIGFVYFMTQKIDREKSDAFWGFMELPPRNQKHPCTVVRDQVSNMKFRSARGAQLPKLTVLAIMIKSWNAFYEGRSVTLFRFQKKEAFPVFSGL